MNLAANLKGWRRFQAAQEWIDRTRVASATTSSAVVTIDPALAKQQAAQAAPGNSAEQQRLFKQFLEWSKKQAR